MLEGVYSLPVIHTLASSHGDRLRDLLKDGLTEADRHNAIECVRSGPGIDSAFETAAGFVAQARAEILTVSKNDAATAMADTAQHLLDTVRAAKAA